jgi:hypothetical protein
MVTSRCYFFSEAMDFLNGHQRGQNLLQDATSTQKSRLDGDNASAYGSSWEAVLSPDLLRDRDASDSHTIVHPSNLAEFTDQSKWTNAKMATNFLTTYGQEGHQGALLQLHCKLNIRILAHFCPDYHVWACPNRLFPILDGPFSCFFRFGSINGYASCRSRKSKIFSSTGIDWSA